jgi:transposase
MGAGVVIGMDPHKRSATIEVMNGEETILGGGRYATDVAGYQAMLTYGRQFEQRTWAIEGCNGIGKHIANRLLADGEQVVDVPPKLSARVRVFATGQGRKTDATDAHSVALVGTRMSGLRPVVADAQLAVLRLLIDRRQSLGDDHTRMVSQLHRLVLELIPGGAKKHLSAAQAKALLGKVRPRDTAGKTRRRVAAEVVADLERIYERTKAADKEPDPPAITLPARIALDQPVLRPVRDALQQRRPGAVVKRSLLDEGEDRRIIDRRERPLVDIEGSQLRTFVRCRARLGQRRLRSGFHWQTRRLW